MLLCIGSTLSAFTHRWNLCAEHRWRSEAHEYINLPFYEPKPLSFTCGKSVCPKCQHPLKYIHLIPVVSFILLKARCSFCKHRIPWRYPLIEASTCLLLLPLYWLPLTMLEWVALILIMTSLICAMIIDAQYLWLPDECMFIVICCATYLFYYNNQTDLLGNVSIGILAYLSIYLIRVFFMMTRKIEAIGLGDAKLMGALTYWLGAGSYSYILLYASLVGLIWAVIIRRHKQRYIPFGPFLILSSFLYFYLKFIP